MENYNRTQAKSEVRPEKENLAGYRLFPSTKD